jgi:hypothetical protein
MTEYTVFEEINRLVADKRRQADVDDLGNETAGRETGRMLRFSLADTQHIQEEKRRREEAYESLLQQMLQNAAYAKLYYETEEILTRAETPTEQALEQIERALLQEKETLRQMEKSANRTSDGKMVFRDAQGNVRDENGTIISTDEAASIVWRDNAPSYEEFRAQQEKLAELRRCEEELRHYQVDVLGNTRDRLTDEKNPPSTDELQQIQKDITEKAPQTIRPELNPSVTTSPTTLQNQDTPDNSTVVKPSL